MELSDATVGAKAWFKYGQNFSSGKSEKWARIRSTRQDSKYAGGLAVEVDSDNGRGQTSWLSIELLEVEL
jgi:hypothetical protein